MSINKSVFKLSNNVLKRYECDWNGGIYFLYNILNNELWAGNSTSKQFIDLIDGKTPLNIIENTIQNILKTNDIKALRNSLNVILLELIEKEIVYEV